MRTELQHVGNSYMVAIPEAFLADCGITKTLNLCLENHRIIIEADKKPRAGWFDHYQTQNDVDMWQDVSPDLDSEDWEW